MACGKIRHDTLGRRLPIMLERVASVDMIADIVTKPIAGAAFYALRARVLGLLPGPGPIWPYKSSPLHSAGVLTHRYNFSYHNPLPSADDCRFVAFGRFGFLITWHRCICLYYVHS